ncbi:HmuY family protein [Raineya sp.]|jgi:hypothetical protein
MNRFSILTLIFSTLLSAVSCKKKEPTPEPLEVKTYKNLYAPQTGGGSSGQPIGGTFTKFSFAKGEIVTDDTWDIAFRGLTIIVNGGSKIGLNEETERTGQAAVSMQIGTFEEINQVPSASSFRQDGQNFYAIPTGSGNGWYSYNSQTFLITPIAGRVFVVKTTNGKYAKFEILSYYKDAPANPNASSDLPRYYTFRYVYQPNGTNF